MKKLEKISKGIRKDIINIVGQNNIGHLGGSLSLVDILVVIYYKIEYDRDVDLILSKGHAALVQYIIINELYNINDDINKFAMVDSKFQAHPTMDITGVSFPTGSLGQGISGAAGIAYAKYKFNDDTFTYVILGDGELNSGQVTEALDTISFLKLKKMKIIVDLNGWQLDKKTEKEFSEEYLLRRFAGYDFVVDVCDGHDFKSLYNTIKKDTEMPHLILAKTIKGKGFKILEDNNDYHGSFISFPNDYKKIVGEEID